jgi:ribosomal protein S18 acetylase RimI-like enzyme
MSQQIIVRRAGPGDVDRAARLAACLVRMHHESDPDRFFLPEQVEQGYAAWFQRELERPAAVLLVALRGEIMVGYCYGALEGRDWNLLLDRHGAIHDVYVSEAAREGGIGGRLLQAMLVELDALDAPRILLSTMVSNEPAQRLFRKFGFRPTMLEMTRERQP